MRHRLGAFEVDGFWPWVKTTVGAAGLIGVGAPILSQIAAMSNGRAPHAALRLWARAATRVLDLRMDIDGMDHVDPSRVYMVAPLHEGLIDPLCIARLPLRTRYIVRDELFEWPYLGRFLHKSGQIEVTTDSADIDLGSVLRDARAATVLGESIVAFPQGSVLGIEVAFRKGPFVLADRLALPLLPVVITGTHRVWEHPFRPTLRYHQPISMEVLAPIPVGSARSDMDSVESEMKSIALSSHMAAPRRFHPARDGYWDGYEYEIDPRFPGLAATIQTHRSGGAPTEKGLL